MATIKDFEDLQTWQMARELNKRIFSLTLYHLFSKDYSLKDQIRRSSGSVMDNIAEGFERDGNKEFINYLSFSKGSAGEVRSQLVRAFDYKYVSQSEMSELKYEYKELWKKNCKLYNLPQTI
ncbi:MAG: four helix bundle protein [Chitinophagales bacterium]|nr:four helix bundle protein [Chitinophagales bacterium]